jgi:hypothetical protein
VAGRPEGSRVPRGGPGVSGYLCHLSYVEASLDADRRMRRGERQAMCQTCRRWLWAHEDCGHPGPRMTDRQMKKSLKEMAIR